MRVVIRCLHCHGSLNRTNTGFSCNSCQTVYSDVDGIFRFNRELPDKEYHFPTDGFDLLYHSEERSFWFQVRNHILVEILRTYVPKDSRLLEVGCGTGFVASFLKKQGFRIECADLSLEGLKYCQMRKSGYAYYQYNLYDEIFFQEFDAILACDVIEHLAEDERVLSNLNRSLKKGGILVLTVPACKGIWSTIDDYAGHKRRYSQREMKRKLEAAGFKVLKNSYFMMLLFPVIALSRMRMRRKATPGEEGNDKMVARARGELSLPPVLNWLFGRIFAIEISIISHMDLPLGSSLITAAVKERSP